MLKILQVTTRHNLGGISKLIINLLGDDTFEQNYVTGYCEANEEEHPFHLNEMNYQLFRISHLRRSINIKSDFLSLIQMIKVIRAVRPDILHTHMSKAGLIGRLASLFVSPQPKRIHSYHGHVLENYFNKYANLIFRRIEKQLGLITDVFLFDGNSILSEIQDFGIKPRGTTAIILPGSIDIQKTPLIPNKLSDDFRILVVARLVPIKGIGVVVDVISILKNQYKITNLKVTIVGDGVLRPEYENLSQERKLPIEFVGWQESVQEFYRNADVLLSTSASEGTPLAFMEAASHGLPIVSSNVGSVGDLVEDGETGLLSDLNAEEIAANLVDLYRDEPARKRMGKNAHAKAQSEFMTATFIQKQSELYLETCSKIKIQ